jgi:hypothetical protein
MSLSEEEKKERKREYYKAYRVVNADKYRKASKRWYEANRDKKRELNRRYRVVNADKIKAYTIVNADKKKVYDKVYYENNVDKAKNDTTFWAKGRISAIKSRCTKDRISFNLTVEYLVSIYPKDGKCPLFGTPLIIGDKTRVNNPSVDRIIPSKGYIEGNVRIISNEANRLKSNATLKELIILVDDAKKHTDHLDSDSEEQSKIRVYYEETTDKMKNGDITLWAKPRISEIKSRCKKDKISFNLTVEYLVSIYPKDGKCPLFGTPLIIGDKTKINSPSVDRIIPSEGYTKGSIRIISNRANRLKSNATLEQLIALVDDAKKYIDHLDSDSEEQPWL